MKKFCVFVALLFAPHVGYATTVNMLAVVNCNSTTNTTAKYFCNKTYTACSSSSPSMAQVTSYYGSLISTNYTYASCGRVYSSGTSSYWIYCFDSNSVSSAQKQFLCNWFANDGGCNSNYLGATVGGVSVAGNAVNKVVSINVEQLQCCQTCTGYTYTDFLDNSVEREQKNTCSTAGACSGATTAALGSYYCKPGYYSSTGTTSVSNTTNPNNLGCTSCASLQSGLTQSDVSSPKKSTAKTQCYIPKGHAMKDSIGTYEYTSNCNYTS